LPIGYNDGLAYRLSNRGRALVRGQSVPIVGAISMDYTTLDVGHVADVSVGDTVTLVGSDGGQSIRVTEMASLVGTIPYEIVCSVGKRVARVYRRGEASPARGAGEAHGAESGA
jgi:alanine racemase